MATVGAAFGSTKLVVEGKEVILGLWDTAGAEKFRSMTRIYYKGAAVAILCYDVTKKATFDSLGYWAQEVRAVEPSCKLVICGTKNDLVSTGSRRGLSQAEAEMFANSLESRHFATSAADGTGVETLFQAIARMAQSRSPSQLNEPGTVHLGNKKEASGRGCSC
eukprot:CAMPEP_0113879950 /NCGR_PEP_ID=MMETSP0780_2-20120614/7514_1 /TAXON_ID=652834 /ORGANISM="Palpitomonas bilix" /LENGTH=163 /DNA_ID=CAMNT_0000866571 /DNA_START=421 /DNA_END=912 /DNA_ORIENTATION=+ /assembly_acc=CAM_ASM_000599